MFRADPFEGQRIHGLGVYIVTVVFVPIPCSVFIQCCQITPYSSAILAMLLCHVVPLGF